VVAESTESFVELAQAHSVLFDQSQAGIREFVSLNAGEKRPQSLKECGKRSSVPVSAPGAVYGTIQNLILDALRAGHHGR
jgi:hypothetical protein